MKKKIANVKLILLGIISFTIPLLFILQANESDNQIKKLKELEIENITLRNRIQYKDSLYSFLKNESIDTIILTKQQPESIVINPKINIPNYSNYLEEISQSLQIIKGSDQVNTDDNSEYSKDFKNIVEKSNYFENKISGLLRQIDSLKELNSLKEDYLLQVNQMSETLEKSLFKICETKKRSEKLKLVDSLCFETSKNNTNFKYNYLSKFDSIFKNNNSSEKIDEDER